MIHLNPFSMGFSDKKGLPSLDQKTRSSINSEEEKNNYLVDFAISVKQRVKIKEIRKQDK